LILFVKLFIIGLSGFFPSDYVEIIKEDAVPKLPPNRKAPAPQIGGETNLLTRLSQQKIRFSLTTIQERPDSVGSNRTDSNDNQSPNDTMPRQNRPPPARKAPVPAEMLLGRASYNKTTRSSLSTSQELKSSEFFSDVSSPVSPSSSRNNSVNVSSTATLVTPVTPSSKFAAGPPNRKAPVPMNLSAGPPSSGMKPLPPGPPGAPKPPSTTSNSATPRSEVSSNEGDIIDPEIRKNEIEDFLRNSIIARQSSVDRPEDDWWKGMSSTYL
jgi:hypothetical protein